MLEWGDRKIVDKSNDPYSMGLGALTSPNDTLLNLDSARSGAFAVLPLLPPLTATCNSSRAASWTGDGLRDIICTCTCTVQQLPCSVSVVYPQDRKGPKLAVCVFGAGQGRERGERGAFVGSQSANSQLESGETLKKRLF